MELTEQQRATLKTHILAQPDLAAIYAVGDLDGLARALNADANPVFFVWKTSVSQDEIMQNGFDWVRVDNLSVGKARIWEWMFGNAERAINPSKANVRAGIAEAWKGTAADLAVRLVVLQHCQRKASRFERVFTTGTGATTNDQGVGPGALVVVGPVSYTDLIGL